ncbi:twin-arginine translocase subunit TatC [Cohnella fermenti]|uniref:Sec-independent protein translocase protein TatC n=1 Tax=Cohnella fermenti TaxID=2565925 RepID=A0A4S4BI29_9BACL|nr:twin-arginine translocase subunit TatC [Cohnella fermenti]THF74249.1 twin-arginine translocase subunit TatC [Cohnella fermenti]
MSAKELAIDPKLIAHLTELRKRLIFVGAWFLGAFFVGLYAAPGTLAYIKNHSGGIRIEWSVFSLSDGLMVYMKCATLIGIALTLPFACYHLWAFARPGLTKAEAKAALLYVPASFALFVSGVSFGYAVGLPMMIRFMMRINRAIGAQELYGIRHYVSFALSFLLPMGAAFEMPLLLLFLTRIGLLTPSSVKTSRKYAYVGLAVVGACISPPDFMSHLSVTVPLLLLFEIGAFLSVRSYRRREKLAVRPA